MSEPGAGDPTKGKTDPAGVCCIDCLPSMDIGNVIELRDRLGTALKQSGPVELRGSMVRSVDAAALQLLAAFFTEAEAGGRTVRWRGPSEPLQRGARLLDLSERLNLVAGEGHEG